MKTKRVRASEAIELPKLPPIRTKAGVPIRASELVKRRHEEAMKAMQRAIDQREDLFIKLVRTHARIWKLARQVQRYEKLV